MKKNKMMSFALALCLMMTGTVTAFAGGPDDGNETIFAGGVIPSDPLTTAQQIQQIKNETTYSADQKNVLVSELLAHKNDVQTFASTRTSAFTLRQFPYYYQLGDYWCVPATVKMTMQHTTGNSASQSDLADSMGVNDNAGVRMDAAVIYLNNNQTATQYTQISPDSVTDLKSDFYAIMKNDDAPAIISTIPTSDAGYPYDLTYHHALCVTGQKSNGSSFRLHDPIYNADIAESYYINASNMMVELSNYIA